MTAVVEAPVPRFESPPDATVFFIVTTLAATWLMQLPAALAWLHVLPGPAERYFAPALLGGFAPLVVATLAARREAGRAGVRALFARLGIRGFDPIWFVVAPALCSLVYIAGRGVYGLVASSEHALRWFYLPENAQRIGAMIIVPFVEETGWRGFALPRLQARFGPLRATLLLGAVWAAWHAMMFIVQGFTPLVFAVGMINIFAGAVLFTWLFNRTRGSLLVAMLAHVGAHLCNPTQSLPADATPFVVYTSAVVVVAAALVVLDRKAWRTAAA
jgi:uncharacterized protein